MRKNIIRAAVGSLLVALYLGVSAWSPRAEASWFSRSETVEGTLTVRSECEEASSRTLYFLDTGTERLSVRFTTEPDQELLTGTRVSITGIRSDGEIVANESSVEALSPDNVTVLPNTIGERRVLVLLVNFQNNTSQPFTAAQADNLMFDPTNTGSITNYYREASYGQTWVTGASRGWFTLPMNADCNAVDQIAIYGKQAAVAAGIDVTAYERFMFVMPGIGCSWSGMGDIGGNNTWINGYLNTRTTAHELGHNLGLSHSKGLDCGTAIIGNNCTVVDYAHPSDMMGQTMVTGHFHPYQKERLGWLNYGASPPITTVESSGTYTISADAVQDLDPKALKILRSTDQYGRRTWYYVEFRRPVGFDSFVAGNQSLMNGVLVTMDNDTYGSQNYVLDMTPSTKNFADAALQVNRGFTDPDFAITITPLSVGSAGAVVTITLGPPPSASPTATPTMTATPSPTTTATPSPSPSTTPSPTPPPCNVNPGVTISPAAIQWRTAGNSVSYSVTVRNNNTSGCRNNTFALQAAAPGGWPVTFSSPTLTISPGKNGSTAAQVGVPAGTLDNFYSVTVTAVNTAFPVYLGSAVSTIGVYSSLSVVLATSQPSYTRGQTAVITATVSALGAPMAGAVTNFVVIKPNGQRVSGRATSNASGVATYSYKSSRSDPLGVYVVSATTSLNGITGSGATSFELR